MTQGDGQASMPMTRFPCRASPNLWGGWSGLSNPGLQTKHLPASEGAGRCAQPSERAGPAPQDPSQEQGGHGPAPGSPPRRLAVRGPRTRGQMTTHTLGSLAHWPLPH